MIENEASENEFKSVGRFGLFIIIIFVVLLTIIVSCTNMVFTSLDISNPCTNYNNTIECNNWRQKYPVEYVKYLNRCIDDTTSFMVILNKNEFSVYEK